MFAEYQGSASAWESVMKSKVGSLLIGIRII